MISVVVPVFNGAHVLPWSAPAVRALDGVAEVVYVDDGSTDGTGALLDALASSVVRVVRLNRNRGRAAARNAGAAASRGDLLVFLDADVRPPPDLAVRFGAALAPETAVATVARIAFDGLGGDPYHDYLRHRRRGVADAAAGAPVPWKHFVTTACAVTRDAFEAAGRFDERVGYGEDLALACALAARAPEGLVAAGATVHMTDAGTLDTALAKVAAFGRSLHVVAEHCPDVYRLAGLDSLRAPSWGLRLAGSSVAAQLVRRSLTRLPLATRVRAVRYLLGQSLLHAHALDAALRARP